jgi:hypothetical protein
VNNLKIDKMKKVVNQIKKYFSIDHIVFLITFLSFVWLCFYKLYWTTGHFTALLFSNADRVSEIVYTIFTSIVASGIFYLFTIYLPRYRKIRDLKKSLCEFIPQIDKYFNAVISQINNARTGKKYTVNEVLLLLEKKDDKNLSMLENDFKIHYTSSNDKRYELMDLMKCQCQILRNIYSRYSKILPVIIQNRMSSSCDFCNLTFSLSAMRPKYVPAFYGSLKEFLEISEELKSFYYIYKKIL